MNQRRLPHDGSTRLELLAATHGLGAGEREEVSDGRA